MSMLCWSGELEICLICVLIEIIEKIVRDANPVATAVCAYFCTSRVCFQLEAVVIGAPLRS